VTGGPVLRDAVPAPVIEPAPVAEPAPATTTP